MTRRIAYNNIVIVNDTSYVFKRKGEIKMTTNENEKLYMVTIDGWNGFGADFYLIGIFDNKETAQKIAEQTSDTTGQYAKVIETEKNRIYTCSHDCWGNYFNDKSIGGYME